MRLPSSRSPAWVLAETGSSAVFSLFSMLLIGRVIGPDATGTGMIAIAAFTLFDLAGATLFPDALVQHRSLQKRHAASALTFATGLGLLAGIAFALLGPLLADWSDAPEVTPLCYALAPLLPLSAFAGAASGLVLREQRFALLAARVLAGQPAGLVVGLGLAFTDFGPWAMVGNQAAATITVFLLMIVLGRVPLRPLLDRMALRELWPVAIPQVAAIGVLVGRYRLFLVVLGLMTTEAVLAVSHFAFRMLDAALVMVWQATGRIGVPRLCALQHDPEQMAETFGDLTQLQALLGMPLAVGIALVAPDLVQSLLGPAWAGAAHAAQIAGFAAVFTFIHGDTLALFLARGKARWNVFVNLAALAVPLISVLIVRPQTPQMVAIAWSAQAIILPPILTWIVLREINRPLSWLLARIAPGLVATGAMTAAVLGLELAVKMPAGVELLAAAGLGGAVYVAVAWAMLGGQMPRALRRHPHQAAPITA